MGYSLESENLLHGHLASIQGLKVFRSMLITQKKNYPALYEFIMSGKSGKIKELVAETGKASQTYAKHPNHNGILTSLIYALKDITSMKQGKGMKDTLYLTDSEG